MNDKKEHIWCVRTAQIPHLDSGPFITGRKANEVLSHLTLAGEWLERTPQLEADRNLRQVIAYALITNRNTGKHLASVRTEKQTDERLHNKHSIGMGGHIDREDSNDFLPDANHIPNVVERAAWREISEETGMYCGLLGFAGIILVTDPEEAEIHHTHVAVVYHLITDHEDFSGEDDKHIRAWETDDGLKLRYKDMETWSKLVTKHYLGISVD